jgi:hypothetical protein
MNHFSAQSKIASKFNLEFGCAIVWQIKFKLSVSTANANPMRLFLPVPYLWI